MEIWKDIKGWENLYKVSNYGNVYSCKSNIILKPTDKNGYLAVKLQNHKVKKTITIHRLVASAFIPNPNNKKEVNHIDCNKKNNCVSNLEWCTRQENHYHKCLNGLNKTEQAVEKNKKPIILLNNNKRYGSMMDACRELGLDVSNVSNVCNHKLSHTKGYIFRFESEEK